MLYINRIIDILNMRFYNVKYCFFYLSSFQIKKSNTPAYNNKYEISSTMNNKGVHSVI